jgi:hypothetical protein
MNGISQALVGPFQRDDTGDQSMAVYPIARGKATRKSLKDFWVLSKRIGYPLTDIVYARPDGDLALEENITLLVHRPQMVKVPDNLRVLSRFGCTDLPMSMLIRARDEVYISTREKDIRPPRMKQFPWDKVA